LHELRLELLALAPRGGVVPHPRQGLDAPLEILDRILEIVLAHGAYGPQGDRGAPPVSSARVEVEVELLEAVAVDVRVDLRRGDVGVAEQRLHGAQVRAVLQKVRGERMTHDVGREARVDPPAAGERVCEASETPPR